MSFVLNSRFIVGFVVGILLYTLWLRKKGVASA